LFEQKCKEAGVTFKLVVKPGADHGWAGMEKEMAMFADWFDEHLRGIKAKE
jgi:dipeptidyl aminopeptidase/acylaminoacyl peptidase